MLKSCLKSAASPQKDGAASIVEVDHVLIFETDLAAEVFANNALPRWVEELIEVGFQLTRHLHISHGVVLA